MKTISLKGKVIGEGKPKVIVPIVGETSADIVAKGSELAASDIDVVEWRIDFYDEVYDLEKAMATLENLHGALGDKLLLFTFRTKEEGGAKAIDPAYYTELNQAAAASGNADFVDVEIFLGDDIVAENIRNIHSAGALVVGSNHDFQKTPDKEEIVRRLRKMQEMGADIPKIALMPTSMEDVLTLLTATHEMYQKYAEKPMITMSMGPFGVISRICGEFFGSSMTFGMMGKASAPGQIPIEELNSTLEILHKALS